MDPSIVNFLRSTGQPSDFASRAVLAASKGISGYSGTSEQNTRLLNILRGGGGGASPPPTPAAPVSQPSPQQQTTPTATPTPGQPQSAQDLVNRGFVGYTGWGDAEALADFRATGGSGKSGATSPGTSGVSTAPGATTGFLNAPAINLPELYQGLFDKSGISQIEQDLSAKSKAYTEAVAKIRDNPYLSEATMTGRLRKLSDKFNADTANIRSDIATKKADIETQLNIQTKQFDINSEQAKTALAQFNTLLSAGALDSASGEDIANITRATGISSSMIQAAIKARTVKQVKTQVITSTSDAGVVTATVLDKNTGKIINQQSLGTIGNVQTESGTGLSVSQTNSLADYLAQVPGYSNREEALQELEKFKSSIITKVGEAGYQQVRNEVDRIFPPPTQSTTQTAQSSSGIFGTIKSFFGSLFKR